MSPSTTNVSFGHKRFLLQVSFQVAAMASEWKEIRKDADDTQDSTQLVLRPAEHQGCSLRLTGTRGLVGEGGVEGVLEAFRG